MYNEFLEKKGVTSGQMTPGLANEFLEEIRNSRDERILAVTRDRVAKYYVGAAINSAIHGDTALASQLMGKARMVVSEAVLRELLGSWLETLGKGVIKAVGHDFLGKGPLIELDLIPPAMYTQDVTVTGPRPID